MAAVDPTPDQIQAVVTALGNLQTTDSANTAAKAVVAQDQTTLATWQATLSTDSATQQQYEAAEQAAIIALQQAVSALTPEQLAKLKLKLSAVQKTALERHTALLDTKRGVVVTAAPPRPLATVARRPVLTRLRARFQNWRENRLHILPRFR